MRRYFILAVSCLFCFQLAGCWVRIPDNHDPKYSPYIGKTAKTTVELYVQDSFFRLLSQAYITILSVYTTPRKNLSYLIALLILLSRRGWESHLILNL